MKYFDMSWSDPLDAQEEAGRYSVGLHNHVIPLVLVIQEEVIGYLTA